MLPACCMQHCVKLKIDLIVGSVKQVCFSLSSSAKDPCLYQFYDGTCRVWNFAATVPVTEWCAQDVDVTYIVGATN